MISRLNETNKLAQELSDRKKEFKAAMFGNKLASFFASPSIGETFLLGELVFTDIQLPFKSLDIAEFKPVDIPAEFKSLMPLEHGERIIIFKVEYEDNKVYAMLISCFDRLDRLIGTDNLNRCLGQTNATECGPNQFAVHYNPDSPKLCLYNSSLQRLSNVSCERFLAICGNSKFVFGVRDTADVPDNPDNDDGNHEHGDDEYDDDEVERGEVLKESEYERIEAHHLDTELSKAFVLCVPPNYFINQIMADEHHLVAMRQTNSEVLHQVYMSVFDLHAICKQIGGGGKKTRNIFLVGAHARIRSKI